MAPTQFVEVRLHSSCTVVALLYPKPQYMTNKNISEHHVLWTLMKSSFLSFPSIHLFLQTSSKIVTAYNLRKNLLDPLSEYTCNSDNSTGCNRTSIRGMDFRGRAINLNSRGGLDLVFVIES